MDLHISRARRRTFLRYLGLGAGASLIAACAPAPSSTTPTASSGAPATTAPAAASGSAVIPVKIAHVAPTEHPLHAASTTIADLLNKNSNGRFQAEVLPNGQLGGEKDILEAIARGDVHATGASTIIAAYAPRVQILDLPFLFKDMDHVVRVLDGPVGQTLRQDLEGKGFHTVGQYPLLPRIVASKRQIGKLDDFKGMKLRAPEIDVYIAAIKAMGATPVTIPYTEIYTSVQTGVVEGLEADPISIFSSKFHEVAPFGTKTNHIIQTHTLVFGGAWYQALPADLKSVVDDAGKQGAAAGIKYSKDNGQKALDGLQAQNFKLSDIDVAPLRSAVGSLYDDYGKKLDAADLIKKAQDTP